MVRARGRGGGRPTRVIGTYRVLRRVYVDAIHRRGRAVDAGWSWKGAAVGVEMRWGGDGVSRAVRLQE